VQANDRGELLIWTKGREILQRKPNAYQIIGRRKVNVEAKVSSSGT
jgi:hypothetical protein